MKDDREFGITIRAGNARALSRREAARHAGDLWMGSRMSASGPAARRRCLANFLLFGNPGGRAADGYRLALGMVHWVSRNPATGVQSGVPAHGQAGANLRGLQRIAGHADLGTTERYVEPSLEAKRRLITLT